MDVGDKHYQLLVSIAEIVESDPDVDADLHHNLAEKSDVFVAIRFGDRMGIIKPIEGLDKGATGAFTGRMDYQRKS